MLFLSGCIPHTGLQPPRLLPGEPCLPARHQTREEEATDRARGLGGGLGIQRGDRGLEGMNSIVLQAGMKPDSQTPPRATNEPRS